MINLYLKLYSYSFLKIEFLSNLYSNSDLNSDLYLNNPEFFLGLK